MMMMHQQHGHIVIHVAICCSLYEASPLVPCLLDTRSALLLVGWAAIAMLAEQLTLRRLSPGEQPPRPRGGGDTNCSGLSCQMRFDTDRPAGEFNTSQYPSPQ